jgi:UDP-N-acetylmuramyl pentapeptide phosphotransferase/UDP-N-acetylglucosamine-1-phosphate transferase
VSALPSSPGTRVHVDDARPTLIGVALLVPAVVALLLASFLLRASALFVPVLVAAIGVLAVVLLVGFVRGPTIDRR